MLSDFLNIFSMFLAYSVENPFMGFFTFWFLGLTLISLFVFVEENLKKMGVDW